MTPEERHALRAKPGSFLHFLRFSRHAPTCTWKEEVNRECDCGYRQYIRDMTLREIARGD